MARGDALLRLAKTLLSRSANLRARLADELATLRDFNAADSAGDSADGAFENSSAAVSAQFAELDARELDQIEQALARWKRGTYGLCEADGGNCQKQIPLDRLNALPCTPFCINCEREMEKYPGWRNRRGAAKWGQIFDWEASLRDQRINLSELARELSGDRRG
jgi:DnaK suppressor protein